jgi:hypothetical protein
MDDRDLNEEQIEQRSLSATLAQAALTGAAAGTANAVANQAINALKKPKPEEEPKQ